MLISKRVILQEKRSGSYGCPNFVDPKCGKALLSHLQIDATEEATMLFTEVMENFGMEIARQMKSPLTPEVIKTVISGIKFGD